MLRLRQLFVGVLDILVYLYVAVLLRLTLVGGFSLTIGALEIRAHGYGNPLIILTGLLVIRWWLRGSAIGGFRLPLVYFVENCRRLAARIRSSPRQLARARLVWIGAVAAVLIAGSVPAVFVLTPYPRQGLTGRYYDNPDWSGSPGLIMRDRTPTLETAQRQWRPSLFSIEWTGVIYVPEAGEYRFALVSDDGSTLWIDNTLVVDNAGAHGEVRVEGAIELEGGFHEIRIRYMQLQGLVTFAATWVPPAEVAGAPPHERPFSEAVIFPELPSSRSFTLYQRSQLFLEILGLLFFVLVAAASLGAFDFALRRHRAGTVTADTRVLISTCRQFLARRQRWVVRPRISGTTVVLSLFALSLLASSARGPDLSSYEDWTEAAFALDLAGADTATISPLGVPVLMWSHGSGLIFAGGHTILGFFGDLRATSLVVGWFASLIFWAALLRILWLVSGGGRTLTFLGAGIAFLGTHAGYYSHVHASESLAMTGVAVLVWRGVEEDDPDGWDALLLGVTCGFLITIKSYLILYSVPTLLVMAMRTRAARLGAGRCVALLGIFAAPVVASALQTGFTNRWMTGSFLQSSYIFGDAAFRSVDFASPQISAVLVHPWHGLLSYHPLYAIAAAGLVGAALTGSRPTTRIFATSGALVVSAHIYLQAGWVAWWLGVATFGSRGLAPASPLLAVGLVWLLARCRDRWPSAFPWLLAATVACCLWSFLLLLQGSSNFRDWTELLVAQVGQLKWFGTPVALLAVAAAAIFALLLGRPDSQSAGDRVLWACAVILAAFSMTHLIVEAAQRPLRELGTFMFLASVAVIVIGIGLASLASALRRIRPSSASHEEGVHTRRRALAAIAALALFVLVSVLFARLAVSIESDIGARRRPERAYEFVNTFSVMDMRATCREYNRVAGFDTQRDALRNFMLRQPGMTAPRLGC